MAMSAAAVAWVCATRSSSTIQPPSIISNGTRIFRIHANGTVEELRTGGSRGSWRPYAPEVLDDKALDKLFQDAIDDATKK
jgi:uncharacterized protein with WD repeat